MWRAFPLLLVMVCSAEAACISIGGREILAGDLAKANPAFSALDPALPFSFAPSAGSQRIVSSFEIDRWAARHGLEGMHAGDLCFERSTRTLDKEDVLNAIEQVLGSNYEDLRVEVAEVCSCDVPAGRLEFPLDGANSPPATQPEAPILWRGHVIAADGIKYPVWARVRAVASISVVRAVATLRTNQVIRKQDIETERVQASPLAFNAKQSISFYEGRVLNTSVARGSILKAELVHAPFDIEKGSLVSVNVLSGNAHLTLAARADSAGNLGQEITLRNPAGTKFQARVTGPGKAEVLVSTIQSADVQSPHSAREADAARPGGGL